MLLTVLGRGNSLCRRPAAKPKGRPPSGESGQTKGGAGDSVRNPPLPGSWCFSVCRGMFSCVGCSAAVPARRPETGCLGVGTRNEPDLGLDIVIGRTVFIVIDHCVRIALDGVAVGAAPISGRGSRALTIRL